MYISLIYIYIYIAIYIYTYIIIPTVPHRDVKGSARVLGESTERLRAGICASQGPQRETPSPAVRFNTFV